MIWLHGWGNLAVSYRIVWDPHGMTLCEVHTLYICEVPRGSEYIPSKGNFEFKIRIMFIVILSVLCGLL